MAHKTARWTRPKLELCTAAQNGSPIGFLSKRGIITGTRLAVMIKSLGSLRSVFSMRKLTHTQRKVGVVERKNSRRVTGSVIGVILAAVATHLLWTAYAQAAQRADAMKMLHQLPPVNAYPHAKVYSGTNDGFKSIVIVSVEPGQNSVSATLSGSWVVTYTGSNPPAVNQISLIGIVQHVAFNIALHGYTHPKVPVPIGMHRYLYHEVQWNNPAWAFDVTQTRNEFKTSVAVIRLASGQVVRIPQHRRP